MHEPQYHVPTATSLVVLVHRVVGANLFAQGAPKLSNLLFALNFVLWIALLKGMYTSMLLNPPPHFRTPVSFPNPFSAILQQQKQTLHVHRKRNNSSQQGSSNLSWDAAAHPTWLETISRGRRKQARRGETKTIWHGGHTLLIAQQPDFIYLLLLLVPIAARSPRQPRMPRRGSWVAWWERARSQP